LYRIISFLAFIACIVWLTLEPSPEPVVVLILSFATFFRDEVHGIVGSNFMSLTPKTSLIRNLKNSKYSFTSPEYINPRILEDLNGWLSDTGDQIVSVNITESNDSNRYFDQITSQEHDNGCPLITSTEDDSAVSYQYLGSSFSGVHILRTWSQSSGTGVFCDVLLVTLSSDSSIDYQDGKHLKVDRLVIKKIGSLPLGDRYEGDLRYRFGFLSIPACNGRKSLRSKSSLTLIL